MHLKLVIPQSILISIQCWLLKCSYRRAKVTPTKSNWDHAVHRILRCIWKSLPISAKLFVQRAGQLTCRSRLVEYEAESTNKRRLAGLSLVLCFHARKQNISIGSRGCHKLPRRDIMSSIVYRVLFSYRQPFDTKETKMHPFKWKNGLINIHHHHRRMKSKLMGLQIPNEIMSNCNYKLAMDGRMSLWLNCKF